MVKNGIIKINKQKIKNGEDMTISIDETNYLKYKEIYCKKCLEKKPKNYNCPDKNRCNKITIRNIRLLENWINDNLGYVLKYNK